MREDAAETGSFALATRAQGELFDYGAWKKPISHLEAGEIEMQLD